MRKKSTNQSKQSANPVKIKQAKKIKRTSERGLTEKERRFCVYYCEKFNATYAAKKAGYSEKTAYIIGFENLRKPKIIAEVDRLKTDLSELVAQMGITKAGIIAEHAKMAFCTMDSINNTWIERKAFNELPDDVKACIAEIDARVEPKTITAPDGSIKTIKIEYVKVKLYDKQRSLDSISKMLGYDAPSKTEISNPDGSLNSNIAINFESLFPDAKKDEV